MYNIFNLSHQYIIRRKWLPLINCFSSAPSGAFSFPLIAATSSPTWSLMMMPIHTSRKAEKNAATSSTTGNAEIMRVFISSTVQYYLHTTSSTHHFFITSFLSTIYIAQATMTIVSSTPSSHCLLKIKCDSSSINSIRWTGQGWLNVPFRAQMVLALHGSPTRVWKQYKYGYEVQQFLKNKVTIRWVQQLNN